MSIADLSIESVAKLFRLRLVHEFVTYSAAISHDAIPAANVDMFREYLMFAKATLIIEAGKVDLHIPASFYPEMTVVFSALDQTELQKFQAQIMPVLDKMAAKIARLEAVSTRHALIYKDGEFSCSYPDDSHEFLDLFKKEIAKNLVFAANSSRAIKEAVGHATSIQIAMNIAGMSELWENKTFGDECMLSFIMDIMAAAGLKFVPRLCRFSFFNEIVVEGPFELIFTANGKKGRRADRLDLQEINEEIVTFYSMGRDSHDTVHFVYESI